MPLLIVSLPFLKLRWQNEHTSLLPELVKKGGGEQAKSRFLPTRMATAISFQLELINWMAVLVDLSAACCQLIFKKVKMSAG